MRIAIITGASSGMGRAFACQISRLYNNLDELWVVARRTERLKELQEQLTLPVRTFDGDLQREYIFERVERELDRHQADVRMLVNAAGYGKMGCFAKVDIKEQSGMIDLNCKALTKMIQICLPYFSKGSRILNVASAAAFAPQPGFAVYAASKSYVYSLSLALRTELKSRGIFVTAVCPGPVDTEFFERSGSLPNSFKSSVKVSSKEVVKLALMDSVRKKPVSVYGYAMKSARGLTKLLPYTWITDIMGAANKISEI